MHAPTLGEFVHEFVAHYVALEGALWRTLRMLLTQPGQLTREYMAGRRRRFVLPLRLYLTASFVFFLVLKLSGGEHGESGPRIVRLDHAAAAASAPSAASHGASTASAGSSASADDRPAIVTLDLEDMEHQKLCEAQPSVCSWGDRILARMTQKAGHAEPAEISHQWVAKAPYAVFMMLPFFAALMKLAYLGRRRPYGEHFVFSLHVHSFWFIALLAAQLLPEALTFLPLLAIPVYGLLALKRVHGGGWWPTLGRALLVSATYGLLLACVSGGLALWVLMMG